MKRVTWTRTENNRSVAIYFKSPEGRKSASHPDVLRISERFGKPVSAVTWKQGQVEAIAGLKKGAYNVQKETINAVERYANKHNRRDIRTRVQKFVG